MALDTRVIISFNSIAKMLGLNPDDKTSFGKTEKNTILEFLGKRLEDWSSGNHPFKGSMLPELSEDVKKLLQKHLHAIFQKRGNVLTIDRLATLYQVDTDDDGDFDDAKTNIRIYIRMHPDTFAVGAGAAPSVYRLKDGKGKDTGEEAPAHGTGTAKDNKHVARYTASIRQMGVSEAQFRKAKQEHGDNLTVKELKEIVRK